MIGKTITHYKILEKLGEGGMGVVYKAQDTKLDRFVALKFLPHEISLSDEDKARFLQEAKAASAVSHANVCVIHDIAEHEGQQFIVMEYVDGKTLRQMVPIEKVQEALGYAIQIGEALEEAHARGVVHRDIKAENVMVNTKNQVKVMDFGLAKLRGSLKLTKTSSTVGTLAYMAPEQIQGGEVDARSDIFSFGVVLYEMLTGRLPFIGEHEAAMMYSILNDNPQPVQRYRPELSSEVLHILNRALEKDPEDRYQTVRDMVIDLRRAKKETSRISRPAVTSPAGAQGRGPASEEQTAVGGGTLEEQRARAMRERETPIPYKRKFLGSAISWIALAGVVAALAVILIFVVKPMRTPKLNPNMTLRTLAVPFSEIGYAGLSHDGNWVAFSARDANKGWSIYFMNVAKGIPRRLTEEYFDECDYSEISPDGSDVLFTAYKSGGAWTVYIVSSLGGTVRKVAERGRGAKWRPDGRLIGYIFNSPSEFGKVEFHTVRPDGSENRLEFTDTLAAMGRTFSFDWSPDGKSVAWLRSPRPIHYNEIFVHDLKSGRERQLTAYRSPIDEVTWTTSNRIFFTSSRLGNTYIWMVPATGGKAVQVTKGTAPPLGVRTSADGKRLVYVEQRMIRHVWSADIDGRNARQVTFDNQDINAPCFSPDNKRICVVIYSSDPLSPTCSAFVMESDGANRSQLIGGDSQWLGAPSWSPDGKHIAYGSRRMDEPVDSSRVYIIDANNPGTPTMIGKGLGGFWINDEDILVCSSEALSHPNSVLYSLLKKEPIEVSQDSTWQIPLPGGKDVLVYDIRSGREGWWVRGAGKEQSATTRQIVPQEYRNSSWPTPSLRYLLSEQANGEMWLISVPNGKRMRLPGIFDHTNPGNMQIRLSRDEKHVVYLEGLADSRLVLIENLFR